MGYGVIGSPADSGSVSLGSSPGTPAQYTSKKKVTTIEYVESLNGSTRAPSSSGLGLWLLKPATRVRIPSGLRETR